MTILGLKHNYTYIYMYIQWGELVFDTLPILQVFPLTNIQKITLYDFSN